MYQMPFVHEMPYLFFRLYFDCSAGSAVFDNIPRADVLSFLVHVPKAWTAGYFHSLWCPGISKSKSGH